VTGLNITTSTEAAGIVRVGIAGEVDIATAPHITDTVHDAITAGIHEILLDMADVTFLDSTGIGTLLQNKHTAAQQHVTLRLVNPNPRVVRVLELTGLLDVLQDGAALPEPAHPRATGMSEPADIAVDCRTR
jgi:anti-sigma B factor antagonist